MKPIHISLQLGKVDVAGKQDAGRELQSLGGHGGKKLEEVRTVMPSEIDGVGLCRDCQTDNVCERMQK